MMNIKRQAISGVKWSAVSRLGQQGLAFVVTAVLARLLSPDAYGLLGMAIVVTGFIAIFKDLGTSSALIQRKEISDELTSSIFWLNGLFGLLSTGIVVLIAPWVALFYHEPQVLPVLRVLSLSFVVSGLSIAQQALLTRQMAFDKLARIELMSVVVGAVVGIGMAASGMGVWSLVGQTLCGSIVITILLWIASPWRPHRTLDWSEVRSVASYSLNLSGFNILNYFVRNVDKILIGRYLGTTSLGYYALAYRLMLYPLGTISTVVGRVLFPAFAQMQDNLARFRRTYLRLCASISVITFPMMLGLLVVATPFVAAILGPPWMLVSTLLMILAPVGMAQSIGTTVGHIYMAKGRTDWMFRWGIAVAALLLPSLMVGLQWGIVGVALAYLIVQLIAVYPNFAIPFKLIGLRVSDLAMALWPTLKPTLLMFGSLVILRIALAWMGIGQSWVVLGVAILTGVLIYSGLMLWSKPPVLKDVMQLLPLRQMSWLRRL